MCVIFLLEDHLCRDMIELNTLFFFDHDEVGIHVIRLFSINNVIGLVFA